MNHLSAISQLPASPGSYGLFFTISRAVSIDIGRLGTSTFPAGFYGYFGSAHGSGGLKARLKHHLLPKTHPHWHIDYLYPYVNFRFCLYSRSNQTALECIWSSSFAVVPDASIPVPHFGSSDCKNHCKSHLIYIPITITLSQLSHNMEMNGNEKVFVIILDPSY